MDAKKALIITWVVIGLLVAGFIGFFIGRSEIGKGLNDLNSIQGPGQLPGNGNQNPGNVINQPGEGNKPPIATPR